MKATELRIGNYVEENLRIKSIDDWNLIKVGQQDLKYIQHEGLNKYYRPIPITEEWLVKFGFRNYGQIKWDTDVLLLIKNGDGFLYLANQRHVNLFYIHQLQNLYHALTGEELTIKQQS